MTENKTVEQLAKEYSCIDEYTDNESTISFFAFKAGYAARDAKYKELESGWQELDNKRVEEYTKLEQALAVADKYFNIIASSQDESDIIIYGKEENVDLAEIALDKIKAIKDGINIPDLNIKKTEEI